MAHTFLFAKHIHDPVRNLAGALTGAGKTLRWGLLALLGTLVPVAPALANLAASMSLAGGYPNPIWLGDITAYRISLTNSNAVSAVTGTSFTDTLPANIIVAGAGLASYTCTNGDGSAAATAGSVTATVGSNTITLAGGTVPAAAASSGSCDIVVEVTSRTPADQGTAPINTIIAGGVTGTDNTGAVTNSSPAQQSITINTLNNPTLSKSFSPSTIVRSDQVTTLTITISNSSNATKDLPLNTGADTPAYALRDVLPVGLEVAGIPNASSTCSGAGVAPTFTPNPADTTLTAVGGTVAAGGTCTLTVAVVGTTTSGNYSSVFANTINRTTDFGNRRGLVPPSNASANLTVTSAMQVAKSFSPTTIAAGQNATLTITLHNGSSLNALTAVQLTENNIKTSGSGAGVLTINNASLSGCGAGDIDFTVNGNKGFALGGVTPATIAANGNCVITLTYTASLAVAGTPETFTDTIPQGAISNSDATIISQTATHSVTVVDQLTVSKTRNPATVAPGNPVNYTVTVNNYSVAPLSNVRITDVLPAGVIALPTSPAAPSVSGAGCGALSHNIPALPATTGTPQFTIATVPSGVGPSPGVCTINFWASSPTSGAGSFSNTIGTGGVCDNNGAGAVCNFGASNSVSSTLASVLTVSKAFSPSSASEGTTSQLTVTYTSLSAQPMTAANFTDNLPIGSAGLQLVVANPANASSTCSGASITAAPGASSFSMSGATIPARAGNGTGTNGTCVLKADVIGAAGNYTNTLNAGAITATETLADTTTRTASSPGPVSASITYTSALTATKSFSPTIIQSGGRSTVTVRLGNVGAGTLNNVGVIDPLPVNMTVATPSNTHTTCGGATTITATPGAASASLSGAVLPASGQCDFVFDVQGTGGSNWVNTIPAGNITAAGGVQNILAVSATLTNNSTGGLTVTNSTSPNSLTAPGQTSVLTISLNNGGALALTNLNLTDYFTTDGTAGGPLSGMRVAASPGAATTCVGGVVSAIADGTSVSLAGASLAVGATCTITLNVTLRSVGTVQNIIPASAVTTAQGVTNVLPTTTSLSALANIGITKQFIPAVIKPGERARLRLTFINPLALPVTNLGVTDTLPPGLTVPPGPSPFTDCAGATVSAPTAGSVAVSNGNMPAASGGVSATCIAEIDVFAAAVGTFNNVIGANTVTSTVGGSSASNPVPANATLYARNPVVITKAFAASQVIPGAVSTLTITLSNGNIIPLTAASLTDNLPANVAVAPTPAASTTCGGTLTAAASATSISLAGGTIPASGSCQIQVNVLSNVPGVYTNTIPTSQLSTAEGITNENPASDVLTVSNPPTITKQFNPAAIPAGGTSTLTITLGNTNAAAMTLSAALVDTLPTVPGNVVIAAVPNVLKTCPGGVTAVAGSGSVTYASGATIPAGGCTISVDVTASATGTHNNTIAAGALQTNLGNNLQAANAGLLVSPLGYISGKVFLDNNLTPNGTFQSGTDTPIGGVTIELLNAASAVLATTTTDITGNYLFTGLVAGTYSVREPAQPTGTVNGITTAGSIAGSGGGTPGTASALGVTPSLISSIVLGGVAQIDGSPGNNFAETVLSSISGKVFLDQNNDGTQQGADNGIAGVTIELLNGASAVVATTTTAADGSYSFTGLTFGTYSVREPTQPSNTSNGITTPGAVPNGGTAGTATAVAIVPSRITGILLPPNTTSAANNFAEIPNGRSLSGVVFLDYNNNGVIDGIDHGIGGQTINLTGIDVNGNAVSRSTTTAANGSYNFTGLPAGNYTVTQPAQPTGTNNGITSAGSTGGAATAVGVTPSAISGINLTNLNTVSANNNYAEIPGAAPDLALAKTHSPASFAQGGSSGYYTITPRNIGPVTTSGIITVVDALPAGMTLAATATGTGWTCPTAAGASVVSCTSNTAIAAGAIGNPIILRVAVAAGLAGQVLINSAFVSGGGEPVGFDGNNSAIDATSIEAAAALQGHVWLDRSHTRKFADPLSIPQAGWIVELLLGGTQVASATTNAAGAYSFTGLSPGSGYEIRFRHPTTGLIFGSAVPNEDPAAKPYTSGVTSSNNPGGAVTTAGTLNSLTLTAGTTIVEQSLPLDPTGVVYDAVTRQPVSGAVVTLGGPGGFNPAIHLVSGSATVSTGADGFYQYLLVPGAPSGIYTITITTYPAGYLPAPSSLIPVCVGTLVIGAAPDPALIQNSNTAPALGITAHNPAACAGIVGGGSATTQYFTGFNLTVGLSANVVNNHIPLDPVLSGAIVMTKITPLVNVARGDLVPYTVTATNTLAATLSGINVLDRIPPGFRYRTGSATLNGVATEPVVTGRDLTWPNLTFTASERKTWKMLLVVGTGVGEGEYVNQTWSVNALINALVSNIATATVRVIPDPTFDCSDIIGKVFDDKNANGYQDDSEPGIANVRVVTARGLLVTTDAEGRFHIACADIPQADHGSNFVMKLDERSLPSGYRVTTENPRDVRVTRGKMVKLNFGATVHRVVRLELTAAAFLTEKNSELLLAPQWEKQLDVIVARLKDRPSVLRISYSGAGEYAKARVDAVAAQIKGRWKKKESESGREKETAHPLVIETELEGAQ